MRNWNVFAAISQKFLKHKNWPKKNNEKPSPINNAWHSWPAKEAKDAVHCQALTRHNWFQLFKGHFPIFIILTVNASSSTQLPSGIFLDVSNHNRLPVLDKRSEPWHCVFLNSSRSLSLNTIHKHPVTNQRCLNSQWENKFWRQM